jgi:hypothetical protein
VTELDADVVKKIIKALVDKDLDEIEPIRSNLDEVVGDMSTKWKRWQTLLTTDWNETLMQVLHAMYFVRSLSYCHRL